FPDIVLETIEPDQLLLKAGVDLTQIEHQIKQKGFFIQSNLSLPSTAKNENQQLMKLLESVEPPPFNLDELPFGNPATNAVDIQKLFQFAIEHQLKVKIEYSNDSYSTSMRKIEPHRLYENILEAYCHSREMTRAFRLDRIRMAKLLR
ncbi:MAG: WYL domain-containing protein, partial [Methanosarcinaceae archaeon]